MSGIIEPEQGRHFAEANDGFEVTFCQLTVEEPVLRERLTARGWSTADGDEAVEEMRTLRQAALVRATLDTTAESPGELAAQGRSLITPVPAVAAMIATVAALPGRRILNAADPDSPDALSISRAVAALLGHSWQELLLDPPPTGTRPAAEAQELGPNPWDAPHRIVLDTTAATELGYRLVGNYATTVADEVDWLRTAANGGPDAHLLPRADDPFFGPLLDYAAEDRYLTAHPDRESARVAPAG